jgi:hypothetical protein
VRTRRVVLRVIDAISCAHAFFFLSFQGIPTLAGVKFIDSDMPTLTNATQLNNNYFTFYNNDPLLAGLASGYVWCVVCIVCPLVINVSFDCSSTGAISYTTIYPLVENLSKEFFLGDFPKARATQDSIFEYDNLINTYIFIIILLFSCRHNQNPSFCFCVGLEASQLLGCFLLSLIPL